MWVVWNFTFNRFWTLMRKLLKTRPGVKYLSFRFDRKNQLLKKGYLYMHTRTRVNGKIQATQEIRQHVTLPWLNDKYQTLGTRQPLSSCRFLTIWHRRCGPGSVSAAAPLCCTAPPLRRWSRRSLLWAAGRGWSGSHVRGSRTWSTLKLGNKMGEAGPAREHSIFWF